LAWATSSTEKPLKALVFSNMALLF
jgi:hypothetical protein